MHAIVDTHFKYNGEKSVVIMKYQVSESHVDRIATEAESRVDTMAQEAHGLTGYLLLGLYSTPKNSPRVLTPPVHVFVLSKIPPKNHNEWGGVWGGLDILRCFGREGASRSH